MSWLSAALLPIIGPVGAEMFAAPMPYVGGVRASFTRDPFEAWIADPRPLTFGEYLADTPVRLANTTAPAPF